MVHIPANSILVPAGNYIVSDPCYVLPDYLYNILVNCMDNDCPSHLTNFGSKFQGADCFVGVVGTKHGDGVYTDSLTSEDFPVDSGLIGVIDCRLPHRADFDYDDAIILQADAPFLMYIDQNGVIRVGD